MWPSGVQPSGGESVRLARYGTFAGFRMCFATFYLFALHFFRSFFLFVIIMFLFSIFILKIYLFAAALGSSLMCVCVCVCRRVANSSVVSDMCVLLPLLV